jgi:hypothetical protein
MALAQAKSGLRIAGHRTNSLAFAKHDCHTCAALGTECDRQRPRCGTCLSNQRKCDGFAMPLIWKNLEIAQSPSRGGDRRCVQPRRRESQRDTEFKFVEGRPKKKRKLRVDGTRESSINHQCFPVDTVHSGTAFLEGQTTLTDLIPSGGNTSYGELDNVYSRSPHLA